MGRVCMGRVCYGPSLSWAEFVMGRVVQLPLGLLFRLFSKAHTCTFFQNFIQLYFLLSFLAFLQ